MAQNFLVEGRSPDRPTRYIILRCPLCNAESDICDQEKDIHRHALREWWSEHLNRYHPPPAPIFEIASEIELPPSALLNDPDNHVERFGSKFPR